MTVDLIIRSIFEHKNFAVKWPIIPTLNQSSSHGIFADVMPLLSIRFSAAQEMIENSFVIHGHEQMKMIWH